MNIIGCVLITVATTNTCPQRLFFFGSNLQFGGRQSIVTIVFMHWQRAKKLVSDSPGLVDFAIGLVNSVFNLPDGQVMFYEEFE